MLRVYALILLLLLGGGFNQAEVFGKTKNLQVNPSVIGYCYYQGNPTDIILLVKLRLKYTNVGQQPLILDKVMSLITYYQVSRTLDDLVAKKYEVDVHVAWNVVGGDSLDSEGEIPSDRFVVLKPDEPYETESEVRITSVQRYAAGDYVMRGVIPTWFDSDGQARRLQKKWRHIGLLRTEGVIVSPISFQIEGYPKIMKDSRECEAAAQQLIQPERE